MSTATKPRPGIDAAGAAPPPLEAGDRLTRAEFHRRYEAMPRVKKAELIEGVVHMGSPVRADHHAAPHADIMAWLGFYRAATPGVRVFDNGTVRLDEDNEYQPDAMLIVEPRRGGRCRISADDYIDGGPELVVEVASSSVGIDLHAKLNVYRRAGVPEYVVWRVREAGLDWFILHEGRYDRLPPDPDGLQRSQIFPGLWLDPTALLTGDLGRVLDALRLGLAAPGHAEFAARLRA